jgi:tetratricopeptide (TPR) repeat protein
VRANGKIWNTSALQLMGEILIRQGRNREAIPYLTESFNFGESRKEAHLDLAIAYCRLREYRNAIQHYSDRAVLVYVEDAFPQSAQQLPGTSSLGSLEASALLARGLCDYYHNDSEATLKYLYDADRLAPGNKLITRFISACFLNHLLPVETIQRYASMRNAGQNAVVAEAKRRMAAIEAFYKLKQGEKKTNEVPPDSIP